MSLHEVKQFLKANDRLPLTKKMKVILTGGYKPREECECGYKLLDLINQNTKKINEKGIILQCPECGRKYMLGTKGK
jgi:hypothetical protein